MEYRFTASLAPRFARSVFGAVLVGSLTLATAHMAGAGFADARVVDPPEGHGLCKFDSGPLYRCSEPLGDFPEPLTVCKPFDERERGIIYVCQLEQLTLRQPRISYLDLREPWTRKESIWLLPLGVAAAVVAGLVLVVVGYYKRRAWQHLGRKDRRGRLLNSRGSPTA
jgi:hypothetical protein